MLGRSVSVWGVLLAGAGPAHAGEAIVHAATAVAVGLQDGSTNVQKWIGLGPSDGRLAVGLSATGKVADVYSAPPRVALGIVAQLRPLPASPVLEPVFTAELDKRFCQGCTGSAALSAGVGLRFAPWMEVEPRFRVAVRDLWSDQRAIAPMLGAAVAFAHGRR